MILVEAPNFQLYTYWAAQYPASSHKYLERGSQLLGYKGEVIVLNGGSRDNILRSFIRRLEVAGHVRVIHQEVLHEFSVPVRLRDHYVRERRAPGPGDVPVA